MKQARPVSALNGKNLPLFAVSLLLLIGSLSCSGNTADYPEPGQGATDAALERYTFESPHMGTLFRITLYAPDDSLATAASKAAFERVEELNRIMSDYLEESELNRLSATSGSGEAVRVSRELFEVLQKSVEISEMSSGQFDVTVGPLVELWRENNRSDTPELPDPVELNRAAERVGYRHMILDVDLQTVELTAPGMKLDLGGIAKGYASDEALSLLREFGIRSALVDGGGDISLGDPPPERDFWTVAVPVSGEGGTVRYLELQLANCSVTTSGDLYQFVEIDGVRYSHIIDPETGLGITEQRSVTVIAQDGLASDGYASALSVLGPERAAELLPQLEGVDVRFEYVREGEIRHWESDGFSRHLKE